MRSPKLTLVCVLVTLLVWDAWSARSHAAPQNAPAPATAEWTLLFYMDADNDLELDQMNDLREMVAAGSTKDVNIIVLADRHPNGDGRKYTNDPVANLKNWTTAKLLYVEKGNLREIADWGEADMGDPSTLKKFLAVAKTFPAKHYGVVLEDHGTSWPGACADESNDGNMLTTGEIAGALADASAATGKFELIGFDACLMANLEVAKAVAPSGKVMVASEELEPGEGWDYTPLLTALARNPKMTGAELGRLIVDTFIASYAKTDDDGANRGDGVTLSVLALDQLPALEKAVSELGLQNQDALAKSGRDSYLKIAQARSDAEEYGKSGDGGEGNAVFDLHNLTQNLQHEEPNSPSARAADGVMQALKNVVLYNQHGRGRPNASGLSIYFPSGKEELTGKQWRSAYPQMTFSQSAKWFPFLTTYTGADEADTTAPELENVATNDAEMDADDVASITAKVDADDLDEANFVLAQVDGDEQTILGALPVEPNAKGELKESWDGQWFTIGDKDKELICPITDFQEISEKEETYWVMVPAQVRFRGTKEWFDVSLYFFTDFSGEEVKGDFVYAFEQTRSGPREIMLESGDDIRTVYFSIDTKGNEHFAAAEDPDDILHLERDGDIQIGRQDVEKGMYRIGFVVTDLAGNTTEKFTDVKID